MWIRSTINAIMQICKCCGKRSPVRSRQNRKLTSGKRHHRDSCELYRLVNEKKNEKKLDIWIRGHGESGESGENKMENEYKTTWNNHSIRYDTKSDRWYLRLSALDVKEQQSGNMKQNRIKFNLYY